MAKPRPIAECCKCSRSLPGRGKRGYSNFAKILCEECGQSFKRNCGICKKEFIPTAITGTRHQYCLQCARDYAKNYNKNKKKIRDILEQRECLWCLKPFSPPMVKSKCCSKACNGSHNMYMRHSGELYRSSKLKFCGCGQLIGKQFFYCFSCRETAIGKLNRHAAVKRRIAAERAGDNGISWRTVGRRDNWFCHLCNEPVMPKAGTAYVPDGATVDHVIPIARGGTHTWDNVALAHRSCNVSRGAKDLECSDNEQ